MSLDVWEIYEQFAQSDRSLMDEKHRGLLAVCDLRQEVASGGVDSYFRYWGADSAPAALAALPEILGSEWANLLEEAMDLFGAPFPINCDDRARFLDNNDLEETLEDLDRRLYDLEEAIDADACLNGYIASRFG
ncbi:DMP19 family protein [Arthrobacter celericrescens]|uniref:DMP19 family protein n=1 Tax=Arthrobacter celericrescens TaxID=2320851 RepID=UPI000EA1FDDD|nr:DUF4375 domain-containing protein [Arthrobacter celericrescens]